VAVGALDTASEPDLAAVAAAPFERPADEAPAAEAGSEVEVEGAVELEVEAAELERPAVPERLVLVAPLWLPV
jgi:hypothetical protein